MSKKVYTYSLKTDCTIFRACFKNYEKIKIICYLLFDICFCE